MSKTNLLPLITERLVNTPLLLTPSKAQIIYDVLQGRISLDVFEIEAAAVDSEAPTPEATRFRGRHRRSDGNFSLARREGGVALIDIEGSLVNRGAWLGASSGLVSYEGIGAQIDAARDDDEITAAILDIDSGGGEATGMVGIAQKVRELAAIKPVVAVVNDYAASAAYGIASGATEIVISPTSFTGSIGVVMVHMDHSGELKKKGVKPTILQMGAKKTHGHPFGPLDGEATASLNKMMTILYDQFLATVEAGRGERLDANAARATEAGIFVGQEAIDAGVADRMGTFDEVLSELQTRARSGGNTKRTVTMDDKSTPAPNADVGAATFTQADMDAAIAKAKTEGAKASTDRVGAILESDEGKANPALAEHFAFKTDMSADDAKAALKAAGPAVKPNAEIPGPGARADETPEMGAADDVPETSAKTDHGWGDVVAEHNKMMN